MGEEGIRDELTAAGIASVGVGCDPFPEGAPDKLIPQVPQDPDIRAVILGYDHWVSLPKLVKVPTPICSFLSPSRLFRPQACTYASHVEPHFFLATNCDERQPTPYHTQVWPETGPFISFAGDSL